MILVGDPLPRPLEPLDGAVAEAGGDGEHGVVVLGVLEAVVGDLEKVDNGLGLDFGFILIFHKAFKFQSYQLTFLVGGRVTANPRSA